MAQRRRARSEAFERMQRAVLQLVRQLMGALKAQYRRISRLAVLPIFLRPLAHCLGRAFHVEQVVNHLEGKSERARISFERFELHRAGAAQPRAAFDRGQKERAGLPAMQLLKLLIVIARPSPIRSITCPPTIPADPAASASRAIVSSTTAGEMLADAELAITLKASVSSASPASVAIASP